MTGEAERLVRELVRRGWTSYCFGRQDDPVALAAVHRGALWADVVVWRGHDRAAAYRTLLMTGVDPLSVDRVVWHYLSDAERTLRAALSISADAMAPVPYAIPVQCRIPEIEHRPWSMRPGALRAGRADA